MAQEASLRAHADEIERALRALSPGQVCYVHVFESSPGSLRAIVAADAFKGVGIAERQERIWEHLHKNADAEHLHSLLGVHLYDLKEYARSFPGGAEGAISMFIEGVREDAN